MFQHVGIGFDGCFDALNGFFHCALQLASAGILVAAAAKEARCHLVAGEVANASEAQLHGARMLCVFVDEDAELCAKHLQGDVHDTFCVAVLDFEAAALFVGEGYDGGIPVVQNFHVDVEQVAL